MSLFKKRDAINDERFNASWKPTIDLRDVTLMGSEFQSVDTLLPK